MVTTQYETFGSAARAADFFWRRILRILPIYALATTMQFINKRNFGGDYSFVNYIKSLLFIPYVGAGKLYQPILAQGWTLNLEMFFYFVFALSLILPRVRGLTLCVLVFVGLAALQGTAADMGMLAFYANHILLFFVCGMLVGLACKHFERDTSSMALPVVAWALLLPAAIWVNLYSEEGLRLVFNVVMVLACVWTAASFQSARPGKWTMLLERLGDASYSTYLFHGFMLGAIKFLSNKVAEGQTLKMILMALFAVVLGNLLGLLMFTFVERPIARIVKSWTSKPRVVPA
ncbi:exopolysaccharide production protein ExoZ [Duganella sp. OV458]|nr:exopolysaccharide production protein ExoZ [Duganella sp. OV458]SDK52028.1 exopolysaccharide production protein ExoZ [Duganella sp. OV510]